MRRLAIRRIVLADLTPDELGEVAGGITGLLCLTYECSGHYPTSADCERTVRDCVYWLRTDMCA